MYDAIVVGARCAGATTAMLLAREGHNVLLLERARIPSDTMSTHYVHQPAIARLASWGLLKSLESSGCPPLGIARWELEDVRLVGCAPPVDGIRAAFGPRRFVLDTILAHAAADSGADLRTGCNVTELLWEEDHVTGVRFQTATGRRCTEVAPLVVGADGRQSLVARKAGAQKYLEQPVSTCLYYTYWSGVPADYEIYVRGRRAVGVVPTNGGLTMVAVQWPRELFGEVKRDIEGHYLDALQAVAPSVHDRVTEGVQEARFSGTGHLPNYFRTAVGSGWALVGDAGHHKDPVGAYGISDAFKQAELLSQAVHDGLAGESHLDTSLRRYAEERDRSAQATYQFNTEAARLEPMPELLEILRVVQDDPVEVDRFFGVIAGILTPEEFVTEELIEGALNRRPVPPSGRR